MNTFRLFSMAALALLMAACSSDDNVIEQQPAQQPGKMHFTATIEAPNSGATTRTVYSESGTSINVAWKVGDEIALIHGGKKDVVTVGTPNPDGSAPISGDITVGTDNEDVVLAYPAAAVSSATPYGTFPFTPDPTCWDKAHAQDGTLEFIQNNIDFRMGSGKLAVSGDPATASLKANVSMPSMISIWKLTLQDNTSAALSATTVTVKANGELVAGATSTAKSAYYLCMVPSFIPAGDLVIEATVGSDTYTYTKAGGVSLTAGLFYQSPVTMYKRDVDLSSLSADFTAKSGQVLSGNLSNNVKISIADGATVTLAGVNINGSGTWMDKDWAGITCEGDATIILADGTTNIVKGFIAGRPGIQAGTTGTTLTIKGNTGSLEASSSGNFSSGIGGAGMTPCGNIEIQGGIITATGTESGTGIGSGFGSTCGTITISGGTVTATGGQYGAGIGSVGTPSYPGTCGNISITGGTVTATGGEFAAGIGSGYDSNCGDITIASTVISVTATKGGSSSHSIGAGYGSDGICGSVTIEDPSKVTQN